MIVTKTRSEWLDILMAVSRAATVAKGESDDPEFMKRFKYACGRNFDRLQSALRVAQGEQDQITSADPGFLEYTRKYDDLGQQFGKRDEDGELILDESDPEKPRYTFDRDSNKAYRDAVDELREEYRDTLDRVDAVWAIEEKIDLFQIKWAWVPERISGGYLFGIADMIEDVPLELRLVPDETTQ